MRTATMLVITSMVGSGVFSTSGILLRELGSAWAVLAAWAVGGLTALAGALVYAELGAAVRESGGEYVLVSRYVHPAAGFVVGLVTFVVGFCAPTAACALAFSRYARAAFESTLPDATSPATLLETLAAASLVVAAAWLHARPSVARERRSAFVQDALSGLKLAFLAAIPIVGLVALGGASREGSALERSSLEDVLDTSPTAFGTAVVFVSFAYSGWNAAAYFAGDLADPVRTLPRALLAGTGCVTLLYLALNAVFLAAAPASTLAGEIAVGHVALAVLFGSGAARALSALIAFGLVSTVGAFVWSGARVLRAMARRHPRLEPFCRGSRAFVVEVGIALGLLATSSFEQLIGSVGVAITLASGLTATCIFRVRRSPAPGYRSPLHPVPVAVYLGLVVATVLAVAVDRPDMTLAVVVTVVVGLVGYGVFSEKHK